MPSRARGTDRQARGRRVRGRSDSNLDQAQVPSAAGIRDRGLHRPGRIPERAGGAARRPTRRGGAPALRGSGRHGFRRGDARRAVQNTARDTARRAAVRGRESPAARGAARRSLGAADLRRGDRVRGLDRRPRAPPGVVRRAAGGQAGRRGARGAGGAHRLAAPGRREPARPKWRAWPSAIRTG